MKRIWIAWSYQRRSVELSKAFTAKFCCFDDYSSSRAKRYLFYIPRTLGLINREKPDILFVQNPSLLLAMLAVFLKPFYRYALIHDLHTPYIKLKEPLRSWFWGAQRLCVRRSDLTIVTNAGMQKLFASGDTAILPDKLPSIPHSRRRELAGDFNVLYICTFSDDEPYESVRGAAATVDGRIHVYVTGAYNKVGWKIENAPENLHLTGFLPETDFFTLLNSVDAVMVLTKQEDCLLCGGYEGVAAGKTLILSDHKALRKYFNKGAVYVNNDAGAIAGGMEMARALHDRHSGEIEILREELRADWATRFETINGMIR